MFQMMNKMAVAYWQKDGLEIYHFEDMKPVKYASGGLDSIKPFRGQFGKKILIVGRELMLHHRKKYPPSSEEKILKAVALEIGEIFPLQKPAFYCRIFQSFSTSTIVDIWAWESEQYERIREVFPFGFVIPEDLTYAVAEPEIKIIQCRGVIHILAHAGGEFLAGASYPGGGFLEEDAQRFISSIEYFNINISKIVIFGELPFAAEKILQADQVGSSRPVIIHAADVNFPVCLSYISALDLKPFKVAGSHRLWEKRDLLLRICLYLLLGYAAMLFMTLKNYDQAIDKINKRMATLNTTNQEVSRGGDDYSDIYDEIKKKQTAGARPLAVMNMLAQSLPQGTYINRMILTDNQVEVFVASKEPLAVLKILGNIPGVNKISIKGAPVRNRNTSLYQFNMIIEFSS